MGRVLTSLLLAVCLAGFEVCASRLNENEHELQERAVPRACNFYAAQQLSGCPSATQFCSNYLHSHGGVSTFTSTQKVTATTTAYSYTFTDTRRGTLGGPSPACETATAKKRQLVEKAAPYGPSCNVRMIEPSRVESGCNCLPSFTYTGRRPRPTATITRTTVVTVSTSTISSDYIYIYSTIPAFMIHPTAVETAASLTFGQLQLTATPRGTQGPFRVSKPGEEDTGDFQSPQFYLYDRIENINDTAYTAQLLSYYDEPGCCNIISSAGVKRTLGEVWIVDNDRFNDYERMNCRLASYTACSTSLTCVFANDITPVKFFVCNTSGGNNDLALFAGDSQAVGLGQEAFSGTCVAVGLVAQHRPGPPIT